MGATSFLEIRWMESSNFSNLLIRPPGVNHMPFAGSLALLPRRIFPSTLKMRRSTETKEVSSTTLANSGCDSHPFCGLRPSASLSSLWFSCIFGNGWLMMC